MHRKETPSELRGRYLRNVLVGGTNALVRSDQIGLSYNPKLEAENGYLKETLLGKLCVVSWNGIGSGELRISVWFDYKEEFHLYPSDYNSPRPIPKRCPLYKVVSACASGWLERKTGKFLQGVGVNDLHPKSYLSYEGELYLSQQPMLKPEGFEASGRFFR